MKRISFIAIALLAFIALPVGAATVTVAPTTVSVVPGQTFTMNVNVDSQGATVTTARAAVSYPNALLEATNFSFASGWMQLSQPGYDQMGNGTVIKSAGFPGGFTGTKTLGTITFRARQSGTANITVAGGSLVLNSNGQSVLSSTGNAVATITAAPAPVNNAPTNNTNTNAPASNPDTSVSSDASANNAGESVGTESGTEADQQAAAAAAAGDVDVSSKNWMWGLLALVVLGGGYWAYNRYSTEG